MSDHEGYDAFEERLLAAGRKGAPPADLVTAALAAIDAAPVPTDAPTANPPTTTPASMILRWLVPIGLAGAVAVLGASALRSNPQGTTLTVMTTASAPASSAKVDAFPSAPAEPPSSASEPPLGPAPSSRAAADVLLRPRANASARSASSAAPAPSIADEVRLVDEARRALVAGDALHALVVLDEHATRFADGALSEERDILRVDALVAAGEENEARAAAKAFVARRPLSAQAARIGRIAERR